MRLIFSAISSINTVSGTSCDPCMSLKQGFPQLYQESKLMTFVFRLNNLLINRIKDFPIRGRRLIWAKKCVSIYFLFKDFLD